MKLEVVFCLYFFTFFFIIFFFVERRRAVQSFRADNIAQQLHNSTSSDFFLKVYFPLSKKKRKIILKKTFKLKVVACFDVAFTPLLRACACSQGQL